MIHAKCGTFIPDSECTYDVIGKRAKVYGDCPNCKQDSRKYLGTISLTSEQVSAHYHDMPVNYFRLVQVVNHCEWVA